MPKIILVLILVAVLGGGGYFLYKSQTQSQLAPGQSTSKTEDSDATSFTGGIADLLRMGRDMQCDFSFADETMITTGKVYVANGGQKVRGDFDATPTGEATTTSSIIQDGKTAYYWSTAMEQGIKMELDLDKSAFDVDSYANTSSDTNPVANLEDDVDYSCKGWRVDNRMFTPPSNVEFMDFSAQIDAMMENNGYDKAQMCGACDSLEGDSKASCLQALGC